MSELIEVWDEVILHINDGHEDYDVPIIITYVGEDDGDTLLDGYFEGFDTEGRMRCCTASMISKTGRTFWDILDEDIEE